MEKMTIYLVMEQFYDGMGPQVSSNEVFLTQEAAELEVDRLIDYWHKNKEYSAWAWKFERVNK